MAGRRAHIGLDRFSEFFEGLPEENKSQGQWKVVQEYTPAGGSGSLRKIAGFIPFNAQESYEALRSRVKDSFGEKYGPGVFYALPCTDRRAEIKDVDMVRIEFTEKEVPVPVKEEQNGSSGGEPLKDIMNTMKRTMKDTADMQAMKVQAKLMKDLMGDKEEEDDVKEAPGMMGGDLSNMLLYRSLFDGDKKKDDGELRALETRLQTQIDKILDAVKPKENSRLEAMMERFIDNQRPKEDSEVKELLKQLINQKNEGQKESTLQTIFAMQLKQQEERDKVREAELRAREDDRKEERRLADERLRAEQSRHAEELKLREQQMRSDAEIRKAELKANDEKAATQAKDQSSYQLKLFEVMKDSRSDSVSTTKAIVDTLVGAGLSSMKTAQQAAESMIDLTQRIGRDDEKPEKDSSFLDILKSLGAIAGPLLGPYASSDAQAKMMQQLSGMSGGAGLDTLLRGMMPGNMGGFEGPPREERRMPPPPPKAPPMRPRPAQEAPAVAPSAPPKASPKPADGGMAMMIAQMLQKNPEIKLMMLGNMQDKLGVDMFVDFLYDLDIPAIDKAIAMLPPQALMMFIKAACTEDEKKIIDANGAWFMELRNAVLEDLREEAEGDDNEEEIQGQVEKVVKTTAKVSAPVPAAPSATPTPPAAPTAATS